MAGVSSFEIEAVREASRRLVRELGFLRDGLAETRLPPSAVHALIEIGASGGMIAGDLSEILSLEKSSVSRMLRKLIEGGEIDEAPGQADARTKTLSLTSKGRATVRDIHAVARQQVAAALGRLPPDRRQIVVEGLAHYADSLSMAGPVASTPPPVAIETGYRPGALARCIDMHARYYARTAGFGRPFEALLASGLAEFSARLDNPANRLWLAIQDEAVVGTVAIDGQDLAPGIAHLRWFIVDDEIRGSGVGRRLLAHAVDFCDRQGFRQIHLWTFQGLDAARRLYEAQHFSLAEETIGRRWGKDVTEQRFERSIDR